jgi:DnaJ-class molecular chaperone
MGIIANPTKPRPDNPCPICNGSGYTPGGQPRTVTCPRCKGTGVNPA